MMLLDFLPERILEIEMVNSVMAYIVKKITGNKSREKCIDHSLRQYEKKQEVEYYRQGYTHRWGHYQALHIIRIVVMHAMKNKMYPLSPFRFWIMMKNKPVQQVFSKRPYTYTQ